MCLWSEFDCHQALLTALLEGHHEDFLCSAWYHCFLASAKRVASSRYGYVAMRILLCI